MMDEVAQRKEQLADAGGSGFESRPCFLRLASKQVIVVRGLEEKTVFANRDLKSGWEDPDEGFRANRPFARGLRFRGSIP